jgi:hypothetical protein
MAEALLVRFVRENQPVVAPTQQAPKQGPKQGKAKGKRAAGKAKSNK